MIKKLLCPMLALMTLFLPSCKSTDLGDVLGALESGDQPLTLNTIVAVSIGGSVPLLLKGFGVDPALASGPILTTVTDICGFFFALGFAALALAQGYL